jgi:hypothetical protein
MLKFSSKRKKKDAMQLICFFLVFTFAFGLEEQLSTLVIKQYYKSPHSGWFHVKIHGGAQVDQVTWCSTIFVPRVGEVPRDIKECHAQALLHAQVFPGNPDYYRFENGEVHVSPLVVSGFWMERPSNLIIHGTFPSGKRLEQVIRINPATERNTPDLVEEKAAGPVYVPTAKPTAKPTANPTETETEPETAPEPETKTLFVSVVSMGAFLMALTIGLVVVRRKTIAGLVPVSSASKEYCSDNVFHFSIDAELEPVESAEHRKRKEENLTILTKMGKGANQSFFANL